MKMMMVKIVGRISDDPLYEVDISLIWPWFPVPQTATSDPPLPGLYPTGGDGHIWAMDFLRWLLG